MTYKELLEEIRNKDNIEVPSTIQFNRTYQKQIKDFLSSIDEYNRTKDTDTLKYSLTKVFRLLEVIFDDNMKRDYDMKLTLKKKDFVIDRLKKYISSYEEMEDEIPDEPVLSFQEAMDEYVNLTLDATKSSAAAEKLLELKSKFTDTLEGQGFDIDQLVSDATGALGEGASPAKSTVEKTVEDENTDTLIIQEEYETIKQVQGMKDGTNFFSGVGYTTEIDGDDTIVTTTKVFKKIKAMIKAIGIE